MKQSALQDLLDTYVSRQNVTIEYKNLLTWRTVKAVDPITLTAGYIPGRIDRMDEGWKLVDTMYVVFGVVVVATLGYYPF